MPRITSTFGYRSTALDVVKAHDLRGSVALITGATSGLGVETARALATAGAELVLAGRDLARGEELAAALRAETSNPHVRAVHLDLGSLTSVRECARTVLALDRPLRILINNAGIMACPFARTVDGFESQFGTNHLGHFLLTALLIPALERAAPSRIVSLSSSGHRRSDVHFDDVNYGQRPYDKWEAYGQSKTANALFAVAVTRKLGARGILANSVMPGGIMTGLQKFLPLDEMKAMGWIDGNGKPHDLFKTPAQGAATSVWAAVGPELEGIGGLYLEDCQQAEPFVPERPFQGYLPHALSPESADRLWALSEQLTGVRV